MGTREFYRRRFGYNWQWAKTGTRSPNRHDNRSQTRNGPRVPKGKYCVSNCEGRAMDEVIRQVLEKDHGLKIGRRIGRGGFAEVYEAQSAEGVPCAIKVLLDPIDEKNPRVDKELENLKLVKAVAGHPNIVTLMDVWVLADYLVTRWELSQEGSLHDLLLRYQGEGKKGIPLKNLLKYIYDAAEAIDFLNGKGIYHRDIKPQNLLLFHGRVKIADLGLAKFAGASTVSHTGSGTIGYLPPEAYDQHRLSKTVDLYSLAATYVKLRTGREPFGENPMEIAQRQVRGEPVVEGLRVGETELVRQALAPKPEDRPQDGARAWVRALYEAYSLTRRLSSAPPVVGPPEYVSPKVQPLATPVPTPRTPKITLQVGQPVYYAEFSPDGRRIVTASVDKTARVWDAQ